MGNFRKASIVLASLMAVLYAASIASSSAVAIDDSPPALPPELTLPPLIEEPGSQLPGVKDIREGLEEVEREKKAKRQLLEEPAAVQARRASRRAFVNADSAEEAGALLRSTFHEDLAALNLDPARFLSDARIEKSFSLDTARVSRNGEASLLDAGIPLKVEDDDGVLKQVDLTLRETQNGYETVNPLVGVNIAKSASVGITLSVGSDEIQIRPVALGSDLGAQPFGTKGTLYANVQPDRDVLAAPVARGVKTLDQLRSVESPQILRYDIELPPKSYLRADGNGGAEILRAGVALVRIPFPTATDAEGTDVPVRLKVEDNSIVLDVSHRENSVSYPILVDPVYELAESWYWYNGWDLQSLSDGSWQWGSNVSWIYGSTSCIYACWGSGRGLFISTPNGAFGGDQFGQWTYTPPGQTSYVTGASLSPFWRDNHNCNKSPYAQPHDYAGIWSPGGWNVLQPNRANDYGHAQLSGAGRVLVVGLGTGPGGSNPCWRDIMLGGVAVWITDPDNPSWNGAPTVASSWTDTATQPISVSASDPGLGVKYFNLFTTNGSGNPVSMIGNAVHPCSGLRANPCPGSWSTQITNYSPSALPSGINPMALRAYDPLPDTHYSGQAVLLKVDHAPPTIKTSGELLLANPVKYHLEVDAEDGWADKFSTAQSGMKKVEFFLDGKYEGTFPESNPPDCSKMDQGIDVGSCKFVGIDVDLPRWMEGKHTLKIVATDSLKHSTSKTLELNLPRDMTPPEFNASGPLHLASGRWHAASASTISLEANDLETGVARAAVFIDNQEATQPIEQKCEFGGCALSHTFNISLAGYAKGPHTVKVLVEDVVGNTLVKSWTVKVDPDPPALNLTTNPQVPSGWLPQLSSLKASFTANDALAGANGSGIAKVEALWPIAGVANPLSEVLYSSTCKGSAESPCQQEVSVNEKATYFNVGIKEGVQQIPVKAYDAAGNASTQTLTLRIDRGSPKVTATGPLVETPVGTLLGANSKLNLTVTDKGSGVKAIELLLNGKVEQTLTLEEIEADGGTQACSGETCTLTYSNFTPEIGTSLASGTHTLLIRAKDRADHIGTKSSQVTLDTRAPALSLAGPLANSAGRELPGTAADLFISVSDANGELLRSGVDSIQVTVDGAPAASHNNCSNGICPEPVSLTYTYDELEWDAGPHVVAVTATDRAGNAVVKKLAINQSISAVAPSCPSGPPDVLTTSEAVSAAEASAAIEASVPSAIEPTKPGDLEAEGGEESPFDPSVEEEGPTSIDQQGVDFVGTPMGGGLEDAPAGVFTVGQANCLKPLQTTSAETKPLEVGGDAVIFANSAPATDTVVRPTAFGTVMITHLRGPKAPSELSWEVELKVGEQLQKLSNGSVAIVRPGGMDFANSQIPSEAATIDPLDIADVQAQIVKAGASLAEANNEVQGEVITVIRAPTAVKANGSTAVGQLKVSGGSIVTASLLPNIIAETIAMIIEANTSPDPVAMCAHAFSNTPNMYSDGCSEPVDPSAEPSPSADESVGFHQLALQALSPQLRADFAAGLDSGLGATASSTTSASGQDKAWCGSHWERAVYCGYFYKDQEYAVSKENELFNFNNTDSTKANAFRHALWVSAMINSAPPDIAALKFAMNHERGQRNSPNRNIRYKSHMDGLNNFTAWVYTAYRTINDQEACAHFVSKVGSALFIGYDQNPIAWSNRVGFQHQNLVYRRKYEGGKLVHLVSQNC